ncbi:ChrR family anti-sigma-E factor [Marinovum sp.]|uniref:ChrR family anti-sigma-E factor n=1 Tax=Marinovum sp. TaxID=2024839 RepID=UPI002B26CDE9|nr:ChrR family anti-sigma-E factor [Marinovum sp.]
MTDEITHHLTDALLMAYSAGTLPEAFNLAVATHVSMCDACRAAVESYDAVGGALLAEDGDAETARMGDDALSAALTRIREAPVEDAVPAAGDVPAPLAGYIGGSLSEVKWRPVGMGVRQAVLATSSEATARLLYIPAGAAMPDHGHKGLELTLVLRGAFFDAAARFGPGDVEVATEADQHTPIADIGEDCICLAVTDAPLRFRRWLPRLAQPFLGI